MTKKAMVLAALCVCLLLLPVWAKADTVFSTLGPFISGGFPPTSDPGYNPTSGAGAASSFVSFGAAFVPPGDFFLTQVIAPIARGAGHPAPTPLFLSVMTDSGGQPGQILESILFQTVTLFGGPAVVPLARDSVLQPILLGGTQYWLVLSTTDIEPNALAIWYANSTGAVGTMAVLQLGQPVTTFTGTLPAFQVDGNPVPEPSSLVLLGTGMAGFIVFLRWRRGRQ